LTNAGVAGCNELNVASRQYGRRSSSINYKPMICWPRVSIWKW